MMTATQIDGHLSKLSGIPLKQLPAPLLPPAERRDVAARHALLHRICNEFDEMPGTALTLPQATRLFGIGDSEICGRILVRLVNDGRLRRTPDGRFRVHTVAA